MLVQEEGGDEEPGEDEEEIDPQVATGQGSSCVEQEDAEERQAPKPVEARNVTGNVPREGTRDGTIDGHGGGSLCLAIVTVRWKDAGGRRGKVAFLTCVTLGLGAVVWATACSTLLGIEDPHQDVPDAHGPEEGAPEAAAVEPCADAGERKITCGTSCVDPLNDPLQCGTCGRSCGGGSCVGGHCEPVNLTDGLRTAVALEVTPSAAFILVLDSGSVTTLFEIAKVAGAPRCNGSGCEVDLGGLEALGLFDGGTPPRPKVLGHDGDDLLVGFVGGAIARRSPAGVWTILARHNISPVAVTAQGRNVYWATGAGPLGEYLFGTDRPNTGVELAGGLLPTAEDLVDQIAVHGPSKQLFFFISPRDHGTVRGFHVRSSTLNQVACGLASCRFADVEAEGMALAGDALYLLQGEATSDVVLRRRAAGGCDEEGPCPRPLLRGSLYGAAHPAILADARHLYWAHTKDGSASLRRIAVDQACDEGTDGGACGELVAGSWLRIYRMAQDDEAVYLVVQASSASPYDVVRVTK